MFEYETWVMTYLVDFKSEMSVKNPDPYARRKKKFFGYWNWWQAPWSSFWFWRVNLQDVSDVYYASKIPYTVDLRSQVGSRTDDPLRRLWCLRDSCTISSILASIPLRVWLLHRQKHKWIKRSTFLASTRFLPLVVLLDFSSLLAMLRTAESLLIAQSASRSTISNHFLSKLIFS